MQALASGAGLQLRPGRPSDRGTLWRLVLQEKLNPLGLEPGRFTVAERGGRPVGIGQLKPLAGGEALELASLVVEEGERGGGVGTALVAELVRQAGGTPIYLTTISRRMGLYQRCGFEEVWRSEVPPFLQAEYLAGLLLAWLVARDRLVLMRRAPGGDGAAQQQAAQQQAVQQERGP